MIGLYAFKSSVAPAGFPYFTGREAHEMLMYRPRFRHPERGAKPVNLAAAEEISAILNFVAAQTGRPRTRCRDAVGGGVGDRQPCLAGAASAASWERSFTDLAARTTRAIIPRATPVAPANKSLSNACHTPSACKLAGDKVLWIFCRLADAALPGLGGGLGSDFILVSSATAAITGRYPRALRFTGPPNVTSTGRHSDLEVRYRLSAGAEWSRTSSSAPDSQRS